MQEEKEGGEAVTYRYQNNGGSIVYPFIKREAGEIDGTMYYDLVTPRGQGGPRIVKSGNSDDVELVTGFDEAFTEYCAQENIIAEYIHFSPWLKQSEKFKQIYDTEFYGFIYCNDLTCDIFKDEYSSNKRRQIRKAQKNDIEIEFTQYLDAINEFLRLYQHVVDRHDVSEYYIFDEEFLESYLDTLPEKTVFAQAKHQGKVIASSMILLGEDIAHHHFTASDPEYRALEATSLLIYEASLYAAKLGRKLFDHGGATPDSGLERFKKQFVYRAKEYPYAAGTKIRNQEIYDQLVREAEIVRSDFFPAYRAV